MKELDNTVMTAHTGTKLPVLRLRDATTPWDIVGRSHVKSGFMQWKAMINGMIAAVLLCFPLRANAQEDYCRGRCIVLREHVKVGALEDPASAFAMPYVTWIGDRYWVTDPFVLPSSILHYAANGKFVGEIGRSGGGPGEFRWVRKATRWPGDSALVSEVYSRAQVVAPDGSARWLGNVPTGLGLVRLSTGVLVAAGSITGVREAAGYPLHLFGANGSYLRSFGLERPDSVQHGIALNRSIAISAHGGFWAAYAGKLRAERWSDGGERLQVVELTPEWFPERSETERGWDEAPPSPAVVAVQERGGQLWFLMQIADHDWAPPARGEQNRRASAHNFRILMDGFIVVADTETGDLIATARVDEPLFGFADIGLAYSIREDSVGLVQIILWKLDLAGPEDTRKRTSGSRQGIGAQ